MDKTVNIYKELLYISSELIKIKLEVYFLLDLNNYKYFATNCACFLALKSVCFRICMFLPFMHCKFALLFKLYSFQNDDICEGHFIDPHISNIISV